MPDFSSLPTHIRHDPHVMDFRITRLELEIKKPDQTHHFGALMSHEVKTPMGSLPLPIAILAGSYLAYSHPETLLKFFGL